MPRLTILTGPSPSGKTTFAKDFRRKHPDTKIVSSLFGAHNYLEMGFDVLVDLHSSYVLGSSSQIIEFFASDTEIAPRSRGDRDKKED